MHHKLAAYQCSHAKGTALLVPRIDTEAPAVCCFLQAVATCMSLIVKAMPLSLCHQLLLPFFYQLCRDSNWRVRRACSLDLPRLAQALQEQQQQEQRRQEQQQQQADIQTSSTSSIFLLPLDGSCCQKTSSCLRTIRMAAELGSLSSSNLMAGGAHTRNKSSSAVTVPLRSTAEIMTKHPMHSSLIMDGLLHGSESQPSLAMPSSSQPQPTLLASSDAHNSDGEQQQQLEGSTGSQQQQQQGREDEAADEASSCPLQRAAALLHDCWCALRQCMELLSADSSHWVKVAAMAGLGPFMLLLPGCQVGQLLLGRFTSMAGSTVVIYEISVALSCAQHFGALAMRLGPERWADMRCAVARGPRCSSGWSQQHFCGSCLRISDCSACAAAEVALAAETGPAHQQLH